MVMCLVVNTSCAHLKHRYCMGYVGSEGRRCECPCHTATAAADDPTGNAKALQRAAEIDATAAKMAKEFAGITDVLTAAMAPWFEQVLSTGRNVADWWGAHREAVLPQFHQLPEETQRRIDALERLYHAFRADGEPI